MKEIGMEKLIELLNEFAPEDFNWCVIDGKIYDKEMGYSEYDVPLNVEMGVYIISKQFGFIKWLVENDKIDLDACEGEKTYNNLTASRDSNYTQYERLLMALAIQDEPIRFICEILK